MGVQREEREREINGGNGDTCNNLSEIRSKLIDGLELLYRFLCFLSLHMYHMNQKQRCNIIIDDIKMIDDMILKLCKEKRRSNQKNYHGYCSTLCNMAKAFATSGLLS